MTAGVLGGNSGTPPFPTVNAGIALAAFWFVASLALSALAGLFELLNTFGGSPIFGKWWLPIAALAVGLFIARIGWSYQAVAP